MQHIFVIMDTVPRYTFLERPLELMLSSNLYVTLRLTVFEIFTVKWENSVSEKPKMVRKTSFLTPHLKTPKDVGIRRDQRHCCRAICSRTKKRRPQMPKCVAFGLYCVLSHFASLHSLSLRSSLSFFTLLLPFHPAHPRR